MRAAERPDVRRRGRVQVACLVLGTLLLLSVLPVTGARLSSAVATTPLVQLVAFLPIVLPVAVLVVALAAVGRSAVLAGLGVAVLMLHAWWVAPLLVGGDRSVADPAVVVVAVNAGRGGVDAAQVLDLLDRDQVDVLVVSELTPELATTLASAGIDERLPNQLLDPRDGPAGTGIWSRWELTADFPVQGTTFAMPQASVAVPDSEPLAVTAVHVYPPLPGGGVEAWAADLASLDAPVPGSAGTRLLLGDFNATLDHVLLRQLLEAGPDGSRLVDAGAAVGAGLSPTWPAFLPVAALDHVLLEADAGYAVHSVERSRLAGTDHLAMLARLATR